MRQGHLHLHLVVLLLLGVTTSGCTPEVEITIGTSNMPASVECGGERHELDAEDRRVLRFSRSVSCSVVQQGREIGHCGCPQKWPFGCGVSVSEEGKVNCQKLEL